MVVANKLIGSTLAITLLHLELLFGARYARQKAHSCKRRRE
jgi:hypothetical protein